MLKDDRVDVIQMVYGECQPIDDENKLSQSDTGDELHPVFSLLLQSGHKASRVHSLLRLINFTLQSLGPTLVQVISNSHRWGTYSKDRVSTDEDSFPTTFKMLSNMCEPQKINSLDILGVTLQADNELVKRERILKQPG